MNLLVVVCFGLVWIQCTVGQTPTPPKPAPLFIFNQNGVLMVFTSVDLTVRQKEAREDVVQTALYTSATGIVKENGSSIDMALDFGPNTAGGLTVTNFSLSMAIEKSDLGYWFMKTSSVSLKGSVTASFDFTDAPLGSAIALSAPEDVSFHCSRFGPLYSRSSMENHTFTIDLRGFQIQPFMANGTAAFGQSYECVGFFSIGILSGIFITLILLAIITWGIAMIMNIKTMDRFDDPKGKPLTFGGND